MYKDQVIENFQTLFHKIGSHQWKSFLLRIKEHSERDDRKQITFDKFLKVLSEFQVYLNQHQQQTILDTYPGRKDGDRVTINIAQLYETRFTEQLKNMYQKVRINEEDEDDIAIDASGYTGNFHRPKNEANLKPFSRQELADLIVKDNQMVQIMRHIKDIDKEHNGYVTVTELDDILKLAYKKELADKNLKEIFKPFASIQNRILIDYKKFRDFLLKKITQANLKSESRRQSQGINLFNTSKDNDHSPDLRKDNTIYGG